MNRKWKHGDVFMSVNVKMIYLVTNESQRYFV